MQSGSCLFVSEDMNNTGGWMPCDLFSEEAKIDTSSFLGLIHIKVFCGILLKIQVPNFYPHRDSEFLNLWSVLGIIFKFLRLFIQLRLRISALD